MAGIPITRHQVSDAKADAIRASVRLARQLPSGDVPSRLATSKDAAELLDFLSDPSVHAPIYSLPKPLSHAALEAFIDDHLEQRARGDGLLFIRPDEAGKIMGYSDLQIWPQWAAAELGGAIRPDKQGQGEGIKGAAASFTWMFETLGLDLICETAALDNIRTAKLLDHLGFVRQGQIVSTSSDGTKRPSLVWEVSRQQWADTHGLEF
jgi:RimJ/RimL family protein N-acetyltransferase